jgi:nitrate/TMAO reductase-like tetraheme cytochrome c subunit
MRNLGLTSTLLLALGTAPALAQGSSCVDCHVANGGEPWAEHQRDWDVSAHARGRVTCEKCHGGDATSFDTQVAHAALVRSSHPKSPTHRANLPATCGRCHPGPRAAFEKSRHHELLQGGSAAAPTCLTCHGAVAARLPSPSELGAACDGCHGAGQPAPRAERAARAKDVLERIRAARAGLEAASALIGKVGDPERRQRLLVAYEEARGPLTLAAHAGHRFVFDDVEQPLLLAHGRSQALLAELASQQSR